MITRENMEYLTTRGIKLTPRDCHDVECMFSSVAKFGRLTPMDQVPLKIAATGPGMRLMQCPRCKSLRMIDV